jgi:hypothetical protein
VAGRQECTILLTAEGSTKQKNAKDSRNSFLERKYLISMMISIDDSSDRQKEFSIPELQYSRTSLY